jgi:curved DNA-binding protein CbpA
MGLQSHFGTAFSAVSKVGFHVYSGVGYNSAISLKKDTDTGMVDYYEFLQISPNADVDTIHRVYRFLAARFHPDNPTTGDPEQFKLLKTAYDVLADRVRRAEYDASRRRSQQEPFSKQVDFMDNMEGELNRRLAVLAVLYQKRRSNAIFPEVSLADIEERMGFPRDYLDFTLWYLQRKGYVAKADNAQYSLTAEGVDFVEKERAGFPTLNKLLTAGSEIPSEDVIKANEEVAAAPPPEAGAASHETPRSSTPIVLPSSMELEYDRRLGKKDRRIGMPDTRRFKAERRIQVKDRRLSPGGKPSIN